MEKTNVGEWQYRTAKIAVRRYGNRWMQMAIIESEPLSVPDGFDPDSAPKQRLACKPVKEFFGTTEDMKF